MVKLIFMVISLSVLAATDFSGKDSMNGIDYKDYEGFTKKSR